MGLNIKNEETYHLVQELASMTGESMTAAVKVAVQERIERIQRSKKSGLAERLLAIGQDSASRFKEPYRSIDHGELLYDDQGLPK